MRLKSVVESRRATPAPRTRFPAAVGAADGIDAGIRIAGNGDELAHGFPLLDFGGDHQNATKPKDDPASGGCGHKHNAAADAQDDTG